MISQDYLDAMVLTQLSGWSDRRMSRSSLKAELSRISNLNDSIFIFKLSGGDVSLVPNRFYEEADISALRNDSIHIQRAVAYLEFINKSIKYANLDLDCEFIMSMHDHPLITHAIPSFAFQKPKGTAPILIPDIDFLINDFYRNKLFDDHLTYAEKANSAIFVGATTGGRHTVESIRLLQNQRIRSARYFAEDPNVTFLLPTIVQCVSDEATEMLRAMGHGVGRKTWQEQFNHRFLLSMDGNGATCSRVAVALRSSSVLVKYDSPNELFYTGHMIPWHHYIPVEDDASVDGLLAVEQREPGCFCRISENGKEFYQANLTSDKCMAYMARILSKYNELFGYESVYSGSAFSDGDSLHPDREILIYATAHIENIGDHNYGPGGWIGAIGSGSSIEGFSLAVEALGAALDIRYKAVSVDGEHLPWRKSGEFIGTRHLRRSIAGFSLSLCGRHSSLFSISYVGKFVGSEVVCSYQDGELCCTPGFIPLEAIRVEVKRL